MGGDSELDGKAKGVDGDRCPKRHPADADVRLRTQWRRQRVYLAVGKMVDSILQSLPATRGRYFEAPRCPEHLKAAQAMCPSGLLREQQGSSTFPNEPEKAIARFNFGYPSQPAKLEGLLGFNSIGSEGKTDVVGLSSTTAMTASGNGLVIFCQRAFAASTKTSGNLAGDVLCIKGQQPRHPAKSYTRTLQRERW